MSTLETLRALWLAVDALEPRAHAELRPLLAAPTGVYQDAHSQIVLQRLFLDGVLDGVYRLVEDAAPERRAALFEQLRTYHPVPHDGDPWYFAGTFQERAQGDLPNATAYLTLMHLLHEQTARYLNADAP